MPQKSRLKLPPLDLGNESLGERIARLRKLAGLTQVELAEKIGIIQGLVSAYELDKLKLSAEMAVRFAQALNVGLDELMGVKVAKKKAAAKRENGELSLKLVRRLKGIEQLPPAKQKALLSMIDSVLTSAER
jgi:transcriptional regulator with XRE-family HTH domain